MKRTNLDPLTMSPARRRLWLAVFLMVGVLTSLGHGGSDPRPLLRDIVNPEDPGCADGTLQITPAGDLQTGVADAPLGLALVLHTSCLSKRDRRLIYPQGSALQWRVTSGGGTVNGLASYDLTLAVSAPQVQWHLGPTVGTQTVLATFEGRSFLFTATAVPPTPGGTCSELVASTGTNFGVERVIEAPERWTLAGSPYRGTRVYVRLGASLTIDPGVQVCVTQLETSGARLVAVGTAAAPIDLSGQSTPSSGAMALEMWGGRDSLGVSSEIRHVRGENVVILGATDHPVLIEDSVFRITGARAGVKECPLVAISRSQDGVGPSTVRRTTFQGYGGVSADCPRAAVTLNDQVAPAAVDSVFAARVTGSPGDGVSVTPRNVAPGPAGWRLEQCELAANGRHGLVLQANVVRVSGCTISSNGGQGVENLNPTLYSVPARGNWWGDAAGPAAAAGDGVSAGVDATLPLLAPPALGY